VSRWQGHTEAKRIAEQLVWKNMLEQSLGQAPPCVSKVTLRKQSLAARGLSSRQPKEIFRAMVDWSQKTIVYFEASLITVKGG
jgi:hypothetical protein